MKNRREHEKTRKLLKVLFSPKLWRKITSITLAFVVFLTTYMMILPALTIDIDTAVEEPGLEVASADIPEEISVSEDGNLQPLNVGEAEVGLIDEYPETYGELVDDAPVFTENVLYDSVDLSEVAYSPDTEYYGGFDDPTYGENSFDTTLELKDNEEYSSAESPEPVSAEETVGDLSDPEWAAEEVDNYFEEVIPEFEQVEENTFSEEPSESLILPEEYSETTAEEPTESLILPEEFSETTTEESDEPEEDGEEIPFNEEQEDSEAVTESAALSAKGTWEEEEEVDVEGESAPCYVLKAEGADYHVTVSFTEEAGIPDGAVLQVTEILPEYMDYEKYVNDAAETLSTEERIMSVNNARFFDITILNEEETVEPNAPVTVLVELADGFAAEPDAAVLHFVDEETKVMDTIDPAEAAVYIEEAENASAAAASTETGMAAEETMVDAIPEAVPVAEETLADAIPETVPVAEEMQAEEFEAGADVQEEVLISEDSSILPEAEDSLSEELFIYPEAEVPISEDGSMISEELPPVGSAFEEEPEKFTFDETMNPIAFVTDSFSVYGFVTATLEKTILASDGHNYKVTVTFGPLTEIPEGAELLVEEIKEGTSSDGVGYEEYAARTENALRLQEKSSEYLRLFDISIVDRDGFEIQPAPGSTVDVSIELADGTGEEVRVVHFADENDAGSFVDAEVDGQTVSFETDGFSVYAVVYTVDFHYEVNGKVYDFSIPGGGFVSLEHLVEVLGIAETGENMESGSERTENVIENVDELAGDMQAADENGEKEAVVDETVPKDRNDPEFEEAININNVEVSEATKKFVADVASVEFSSPELVWAGKVETDSTVGTLKEMNVPEIRYSAELTEEQIADINSSIVEAGDWALISVQPFTSEETLTVTMKNGDRFVVKVTDAQISAHVITADGEDYIITVTYGPEAEIPDGAKLEAREILEGTDEFEDMLARSWEVLTYSDETQVEIYFSRFFDISIITPEGDKIEPASPVSVSVQYAQAIEMNDAKPTIVHFAEDGIEVIEAEGRLEGDGEEGTINVFEYEQGSFSGIGTIVNSSSIVDGKYFMIHATGGKQYALTTSGGTVEVDYDTSEKTVKAKDGTDETTLLWNLRYVGNGYYSIHGDNGKYIVLGEDGGIVGDSMEYIYPYWYGYDPAVSGSQGDGYAFYNAVNPYDSDTWIPLSFSDGLTYTTGGTATRVRLAKYSVDSAPTGQPPAVNTYTGHPVDPKQVNDWLLSLFDDMPVGRIDGYTKTAEVYDYENRIYAVDLTAKSNSQGVMGNLDIAFSVDMSNSMLFPKAMTEIGTVDMNQSAVANMFAGRENEVFFVVADIPNTYTVNAIFYEDGKWKYEDASKWARGQRGGNNQDYIIPNTTTRISTKRDTNNNNYYDTGTYTVYTAEGDYVNYVKTNAGAVWDNPDNRLAEMKTSLSIAFNFLSEMSNKYKVNIRVGWNGFAADVTGTKTGTGNNTELFNYSANPNNSAAKGQALTSLSDVYWMDMVSGFADAGAQTGGGTRPDKAFQDAIDYMGWDADPDTKKILVLITDGAPQGGSIPTGQNSNTYPLSEGKSKGLALKTQKDVDIVSIGLSTEHIDSADNLFQYISASDADGLKLVYQAKDGDVLRDALMDTLRQMVEQAITVGTVKDTIDPAFYPVSTDGNPLKVNDKIDLTGKLTTDTSKPYGVIGWDDTQKCWTVQWSEQDIVWPDEEHPDGWHGRVLVKAKENFLGGNDISTNKGQASLDVIDAKVKTTQNQDGSWNYKRVPFSTLVEIDDSQLETRYMDTPHVNVDELEMTKNDTEWTVYMDTKVDPGEQMKALFNEIKVMKVVTDGVHEMVVPQGKTSRDVMVYDLVPTESGSYSYQEAASDARDKRQVDQAFFYLKDLFDMKDSLDNDFIIDNMTAEQAITGLLAGEKVEVKYQGYGHGTTEKPVGTIILELKADPNAQVDNLEEHTAGPAGNAVEKYILSAEYKPMPESGSSDWYWNTGAFGTKDRGKQTEDKTRYNNHIINVIKRIITIQKVNSAGNPITDTGAGEAQFEIYQKDTTGNKINSTTVTTSGLSYTWDYVVPDADQEVPGEYWKDATAWYLKEVSAPAGYAKYDGEIPITLNISDTKTEMVSADTGNTVLSDWVQDASLSAAGNDYVTVSGDNDITIAVKNEKYGGLKILKHVTYNHEVPTSSEQKSKLAGTYTFTVYTDENCQVPYQEDGHEKTLTVTIANDGTAQNSQEISLPPGKYWIKENEPENDTYPLAEKVEVTVKEDHTGENAAIASFTNNINEGEDEVMITVRKTFSGITAAQIPDNFKVTVTNGTDTYELTNEPHIGNITWAEAAGGLEWTWKIYGITPGTTYTVSESGETITGYDVTTTGTGSSQTIAPAQMTFSIAEIATTCSHNDWPVTNNTLFAASTTNKTGGKGTLIVTKNRLSLSERKAVEEILRPMLVSHDANVWKMPVRYYSVEDNPTGFKINAGVVTYNVDDQEVVLSDTDIWQHVASVNYTKTDPTSADFNVTNTYVKEEIDISLVKVDVNHLDDTDPETLPGATFTVEKYKTLAPEEKDTAWGTDGKKTIEDTEGTGTFSFEGLTIGYYKIIEDIFPDGYIQTGETPIIEVRAGETGGELEVHLLKKGEGNKYVDVTGNKNDAVKITNKTVTIGNTPGAVLPNTGGPGTRIFTLLGTMFIMLAGAGLILLRRKIIF